MDKTTLREWITTNLWKDGKIVHGRMKRWSASSPYWVEKHYHFVFECIMSCSGRTFAEKVYLLLHNKDYIPVCKSTNCMNVVGFKGTDKGHYDYCSRVCMNNNIELTATKVTNKRACGGYEQAMISTKLMFLKKYGVDCISSIPGVQDKRTNTLMQRYGVDNPAKAPEFEQKQRDTNQRRYGCDKPLQNVELHEKAMNRGLGRSKARWLPDRSIWYQGTYEKRFLDDALSKGWNIKRGMQVTYRHIDGKIKRYTPDFIVDNLRVYEIKSVWTWDNMKQNKLLRVVNKLKLRAVKQAGYEVILVLEGKMFQYSDVIKSKEIQL